MTQIGGPDYKQYYMAVSPADGHFWLWNKKSSLEDPVSSNHDSGVNCGGREEGQD